jgi:site-specific recombinase XerD
MSICKPLDDFIVYLDTIKGKSPNTVSEYTYDLKLFLQFQKKRFFNLKDDITNIDISDLDIDTVKKIKLHDIFAFLNYLDKERHNSPRTRARKVASIRSFFKYHVDVVESFENNPCKNLENPKFRKEHPIYLELNEAKKLLDTVHQSESYRDIAIFTIFLNCGVRLGEIVSIDINKIQSDHLIVLGKGNKERVIYINSICKEAIENYLNNVRLQKSVDSPALFLSKRNNRISRRAIQHLVQKYIKLAGLPPEYTTHKLRHTAATLMYKYGSVDIRTLQEILGHVSVATTEIYTHLDNEQIRSAMNKNPLNNKN